jgi:preprotein translocase subunit SecG
MIAGMLNLLIVVTGVFLIGVVLIQRGKGGGLAGAFGGQGGSSPFGSKAGDAFTKFTVYVFVVWLTLIMIQVRVMNPSSDAPVVLPGAGPQQ